MFAVVTTEHRGVFFGRLETHDIIGKTAVLTDAQMCVYWSAKTRGVLGLASAGPAKGSRVTAVVARLELNGVTAIMEASEQAVAAWRKEPWE